MFSKHFNLTFLLLAFAMMLITFTNAHPTGTISADQDSTGIERKTVEIDRDVLVEDPITVNLTYTSTSTIATRTLLGRDPPDVLPTPHPWLACRARTSQGYIPGECIAAIDMTRDNEWNLGVTIYGHDCRQLGEEYGGRRGSALAVGSELPYTLDITTDKGWSDGSPGWIAAYAGRQYTWWTGRNAGIVFEGDQDYMETAIYEHWSSALLWFKCTA